MKKVALLIFNNFEEIEALFPLDLLRRANIEVDLISIDDNKNVKGSHNIIVIADKIFSEVNFEIYDGIILPGGAGYIEYKNKKELFDIVKKFEVENKLIAAICAAPSFLAINNVLKNKKATIFKGMENILVENSAIYLDEAVVIDGNIITARSIASAKDFSLEIVKYLLGQEKMYNLKKEIIDY